MKVDNNNDKILFFIFESMREHTMAATIIAHAIKSRGVEPVFIVCDNIIDACEYTIPTQDVCTKCLYTSITTISQMGFDNILPSRQFLTNSELINIKSIVYNMNIKELLTTQIAGKYTPEILDYSLRNIFRIEAPYLSHNYLNVWHKFVASSIILENMINAAILQFHPSSIYAFGGAPYAKRIIYELAQIKHINIILQEFTQNGLLIYINEFLRKFPVKPEIFNNVPTNPIFIDRVKKLFKQKVEKSKKFYSINRFVYDKTDHKYHISLFTTLGWELTTQENNRPFFTQQDWILSTINYFKNKADYLLTIRIHPAESFSEVNWRANEFTASQIYYYYPKLPDNIQLLDCSDSVNSYDLLRICDAVIVNTSTIGLESACLGTSTVVVGDIFYKGFGFTYDVYSIEEYFTTIDNAIKSPMTEDQIINALRMYHCHFNNNHLIQVPKFIRQSKNWYNPDSVNLNIAHDSRIDIKSIENLQNYVEHDLKELSDYIYSNLYPNSAKNHLKMFNVKWNCIIERLNSLIEYYNCDNNTKLSKMLNYTKLQIEKKDFSQIIYSSHKKEDKDFSKTGFASPIVQKGGNNILIIDPFLPFFDKASGSLRLFNMIKILIDLNFRITFISRSSYLKQKYNSILEKLGVKVYAGDRIACEAYRINETSEYIDYNNLFNVAFKYAIVDFWHMGQYYIPLIRKYSPKTRIILDTIDIHFIRKLREAELLKDENLKIKALKQKKQEISVYKASDEIWVVTEEDKKAISTFVSNIPIHILPNIHKKIGYKKDYKVSKDIIFVGNFQHSPNIDAIIFFINEIFPKIVLLIPDIRLFIVGNKPPNAIVEKGSSNIIITGYVEKLSPYLKNARVSISPLRYGSGMKGKIGEALSWGLPVVTTTIGAEGMNLENGKHALISNEPDEFAKYVVQLYNDENLWNKLSKNGKQLVDNNWSPGKILEKLESIFFNQSFQVPKYQKVSIIILTHNAFEYTVKCIESIFSHTKELFELIVVDNGSTDGTLEYLESEARGRGPGDQIKIIKNKENLGFAAGNNQGMAAARGNYILLMNNDIVVTPGWLERMISCAERNPNIGIVGPMSNYVSGPQLVKNVTYDIQTLNGLEDFATKFSNQHRWTIPTLFEGGGFLHADQKGCHRKIGGMDDSYGLGNFEDDDFSIRATLAGFESWIAKDCFIHHFGSRTFIGAKIDYRESLNRNWEIFKKKWNFPKEMPYGSYDVSEILKKGIYSRKTLSPPFQ
jgi:GT2 family glycosyltransferase/glycosyltransferase involved in cell wall biosynthesis